MMQDGRTITQEEIKAIEASLPDVGEFVAGVEQDRPLSQWDKEEILRLLLTTVRSFQGHMEEITIKDGPPF